METYTFTAELYHKTLGMLRKLFIKFSLIVFVVIMLNLLLDSIGRFIENETILMIIGYTLNISIILVLPLFLILFMFRMFPLHFIFRNDKRLKIEISDDKLSLSSDKFNKQISLNGASVYIGTFEHPYIVNKEGTVCIIKNGDHDIRIAGIDSFLDSHQYNYKSTKKFDIALDNDDFLSLVTSLLHHKNISYKAYDAPITLRLSYIVLTKIVGETLFFLFFITKFFIGYTDVDTIIVNVIILVISTIMVFVYWSKRRKWHNATIDIVDNLFTVYKPHSKEIYQQKPIEKLRIKRFNMFGKPLLRIMKLKFRPLIIYTDNKGLAFKDVPGLSLIEGIYVVISPIEWQRFMDKLVPLVSKKKKGQR